MGWCLLNTKKMEELIARFKTEPLYLLEVIVWNNYEEVLTNFTNHTDADLSNEEALILELKLFINDGFGDIVATVLNVPFLEENSTPKLTEAYNYLRDNSGNVFNGLYKSVQLAIDKDNEAVEPQKTAEELTTANKKATVTMSSKTTFVGDAKSVVVLALVIIVALYVATKIKLK